MIVNSRPGLLAILGSLRLTVTLLGIAIFIVFAGTLAQVHSGTWTAVDQYFRCWIGWIEFRIFFPEGTQVPGRIPFPGGWLVGAVLVVNLLVAHANRIQLKATGGRRMTGAAVLAAGVVLTCVVVTHVFNPESAGPGMSPSWRVTWQLIQGSAAAGLLFCGCRILFERKAGIVLLHAGIILLMVSELATGLFAHEATMTLPEGQEMNYVEDSREVELAVIDPSDPKMDDVVVIPGSALRRHRKISSPELPFDLWVQEGRYIRNAGLRKPAPGDRNPATAGSGLTMFAVERGEEKGVDSEGRIDLPAAYVTLENRKTGVTMGTYLTAVSLSLERAPQRVAFGAKTYELTLRLRRTYKPYSLYLYDFDFKRYPGTETPKDYSAHVRVIDPSRGVHRDVRIWMNNPLRYGGDTIYQSGFDKASEATTVLQVVDNDGWMVPYVACMIVAAGMLGQFGLHLAGFLRRREAGA